MLLPLLLALRIFFY